MKTLARLNLLTRLFIGIAVGILIGWAAQDMALLYPVMVLYATFQALFGSLLTFSIPLVIIGFIIPGITEIGKGAGKMLFVAVLFASVFTVSAGFFAYFATSAFSGIVVDAAPFALGEYADPVGPAVSIAIAPVMPVMTALVFSFVVGVALVNMDGESQIKKFFFEFQGIIKSLIAKVIIPLLPVHISAIFANIAYVGQAGDMAVAFLATFILIIAMHIVFLLVVYSIAGSLFKKCPFRLLRKMLPSYMTAIGTQSSAATIPVNLVNVKRLGVKESVAEFVVPLCATINLPGSTMSIVACAIVVMHMYGMDVSLEIIAPFIFGLSVLMIAAPGVPGGAIVAAFGALEGALGFDAVHLAVMTALYIAQDSLGTAVNVTSDGAISMYINRLLGNKTLKDVV